MKLLTLSTVLLVLLFYAPLYGQQNANAKSFEEYTKMYKSSKYTMARSHAEFYAMAKENEVLWKRFKNRKFAMDFLKALKFCKDGVMTLNLLVKDKAFEEQVGDVLGFSSSFWNKWKKGYACESSSGFDIPGDYDCVPSSIHSKCNSKSCGQEALKGVDFSPREVLHG